MDSNQNHPAAAGGSSSNCSGLRPVKRTPQIKPSEQNQNPQIGLLDSSSEEPDSESRAAFIYQQQEEEEEAGLHVFLLGSATLSPGPWGRTGRRRGRQTEERLKHDPLPSSTEPQNLRDSLRNPILDCRLERRSEGGGGGRGRRIPGGAN